MRTFWFQRFDVSGLASRQHGIWLRYGVAVFSVLVATALRLLLDSLWGDQFAFITYFLAVVFAGWYGGFRPAILALVLCAILAKLLFLSPRGTLLFQGPDLATGFGLYIFLSLVICLVMESQRRAHLRAEAISGEIVKKNEELQGEVAKRGQVEEELRGLNTVLEQRVAERTAAAEQRAETIRLYADIVKSVPFGLLTLRLENPDDDRSLRIVDANPSASELLGFDVRGVLGTTLVEAFPRNTPEMLKSYAGVVRSGIATELDELQYGDDRVTANYWAVKAFPLPDRQVGLAFEDISARRRVEEILRRLNEELEQRVAARTAELEVLRRRLDLLLNSAGEGIFGLDLDGVTTFANPAGARMLGRNVEELVGKPQHELIHHTQPDGSPYPREECPIYRAFIDGVVQRRDDEVFWRKDGTCFPIEYISSPIREEGRVAGAVVVFRDISERRQAEELLREQEAHFRGLFEHTGVAMVLTDMEHCFVQMNDAFADYLGYTREELLALSMPDVSHADDIAESYARRELLKSGEIAYFQTEKRHVRKDGRIVWGLVSVSLLRDAAGRPWRYSAQVQDITERKHAEETLQRLNVELEDRVRDRTMAIAHLDEVNRDLAQKNAENEMFVYSVSHDLRSPLVNLQGFSKELEKGCQQLAVLFEEETVPPAVRDRVRALLAGKMTKSLGFIQSAVLRLSGIIDALLRLSRAGRVEYRYERVDVERIVKRVIESLHGTIAERKACVTVGDLPPVWGDAMALEQVFANLIGNALTYLNRERAGVIEVGCVPTGEGGSRTYYVKDNGLGIAEGHQGKIFQAFQRAHPTVATGEGLGLAIVARVVERHRGRVWVDSQVGEGSTFFVTLPTIGDVVG